MSTSEVCSFVEMMVSYLRTSRGTRAIESLSSECDILPSSLEEYLNQGPCRRKEITSQLCRIYREVRSTNSEKAAACLYLVAILSRGWLRLVEKMYTSEGILESLEFVMREDKSFLHIKSSARWVVERQKIQRRYEAEKVSLSSLQSSQEPFPFDSINQVLSGMCGRDRLLIDVLLNAEKTKRGNLKSGTPLELSKVLGLSLGSTMTKISQARKTLKESLASLS